MKRKRSTKQGGVRRRTMKKESQLGKSTKVSIIWQERERWGEREKDGGERVERESERWGRERVMGTERAGFPTGSSKGGAYPSKKIATSP